jgi:hypothetical protein
MITLLTILFIWFFISVYRIYKKSGSWKEFAVTQSTVIDFLGFILGIYVIVGLFVYICVLYLP